MLYLAAVINVVTARLDRSTRPQRCLSTAESGRRALSGKWSGEYEVLGDVQLSPEEDVLAREQIRQADSEVHY